MLIHPMAERLRGIGLTAMADAFIDMQSNSTADDLSREDWLGLLLDREATSRENKRLGRRLRHARLRQNATIEDTDFRAPRGLDRALFQKLATCRWVRDNQHLVIGGPTGVGKSWLACALGHKACREGFSVLYRRAPRLFTELAIARGEGRLARLMATLGTHAPADHRRLGAGTADRRSAARPARDRRRPIRDRLAADHKPASSESMARSHRGSHNRRCDSGPRRSPRAPHRAQGPQPSQAPSSKPHRHRRRGLDERQG
jgi:IstB-like ATP binding protein